MSYVNELITQEIEDEIFRDASCDPSKLFLLKRRNYFSTRTKRDSARSIDHKKQAYLFRAPSVDIRAIGYEYFFFYRQNMYRIAREQESELYIWETFTDKSLKKELETEVLNAFANFPLDGIINSRYIVGDLRFKVEGK
ncbi:MULTISPECIES: hypothetical protein [unclassified Agarivorans]|uniref:hypothetical protein n=1 Tax=unclassified Agarivorans TaxID=2636026 RepID=UPI0026E4425E|nr:MULTISPECIES: hypothetical protein [unclassified Agarivorans]MDO6686738.1 hypothetical protein [Agarivorans sp. 3_MG-2023]MDO6716532.1 hypothetical protein [Agarivorans sp. 2_MG-2023]